MGWTRNQLLVFGTAAILRIVLFTAFPDLQSILTHRVEISTPVTSFKRLQEGLYLYVHNLSPYDGGVYHQAPLFLPLFSLLPDYRSSPVWTNMIYVLVDLSSAFALMQIAGSDESSVSRLFKSPRHGLKWSPTAIAGAFLFNPYTLATCIAQPTSVFTNCAIFHSIAKAIEGNTFNSIFALALASYFSIYPVLLAAPMALLTYDRGFADRKAAWRPIPFLLLYLTGLTAAVLALMGVSYCIMGFSWEFLASTYGPHILLSDLTPNVGLWWYFFIEMFDSFREFFLGVFWLHMASYVGGLTFRIRKQPLFVLSTMMGIFAIFKPYPSIADASAYFALLPLFRHIFPPLMYASFLGPAFYHLWIYAGSGNANFFYAITLVWSLGLTVVVGDSIWAALRDEIEAERPELQGKDVRQI